MGILTTMFIVVAGLGITYYLVYGKNKKKETPYEHIDVMTGQRAPYMKIGADYSNYDYVFPEVKNIGEHYKKTVPLKITPDEIDKWRIPVNYPLDYSWAREDSWFNRYMGMRGRYLQETPRLSTTY